MKKYFSITLELTIGLINEMLSFDKINFNSPIKLKDDQAKLFKVINLLA